MTDAKLLAVSLWEAVDDLDRIDETPHGQVPKLLDAAIKDHCLRYGHVSAGDYAAVAFQVIRALKDTRHD